jgi:hypothetical protein
VLAADGFDFEEGGKVEMGSGWMDRPKSYAASRILGSDQD